MKKIIALFLVLASINVSCMNEDDADSVIVLAKSSADEVQGGDKLYFDIKARAFDSKLISFEIESFDNIYGSSIIYKTELDQKEYSYRFIYDAPNIDTDTLNIELTFKATDDIGNSQSIKKYIVIIGAATSIEEYEGITLYSPYSGKEDAFSFSIMQKIKSSETEDANVDIYVMANDDSPTNIGRSWGSKTGIRFCKANNFDYPAATIQSLDAVYNSSVTSTSVNELNVDDIIIVGNEFGAVAVIRIVNIYDAEGYEFDRYDINIKTQNTNDIPEK